MFPPPPPRASSALASEPAPCSPTLGAHEYRLFQEIASNSNLLPSPTNKKTLLKLPKGIASGHGRSSNGVNGGGVDGVKAVNGNNGSITPKNNASVIPAVTAVATGAAAAAASAGVPPADPCLSDAAITPPPLLDSNPRTRSNATPHSIPAAATVAAAPGQPGVPPAASPPPSAPLESTTPGSEEKKSIWDQPASSRQKSRGPKYYTARRSRPARAPSLPPSGPGAGDGASSGGGGPDHQRRSSVGSGILLGGDAVSAREAGGYSSGGGTGSGYSSDDSSFLSREDSRQKVTADSQSREARRTRRAEIQRRMWGKRPEWTTALLAPALTNSAGGAAAAASMPKVGGGAAGTGERGPKPAPTESGVNQLIVLVHGLGGRPADMALMRGFLQTLMPGAEVGGLTTNLE